MQIKSGVWRQRLLCNSWFHC